MSETVAPQPGNHLVKLFETASHDEVYERGVRLVSDRIMTLVAKSHLITDRNFGGDYVSTSVLYSEEKDVSAEVLLVVTVDKDAQDNSRGVSLEDDEVGTVLTSPAAAISGLRVSVDFMKGEVSPNPHSYGDMGYFEDYGGYDDDEEEEEDDYPILGSLELNAKPSGEIKLLAHVTGSLPAGDGHVELGAVASMEQWLKDADLVRPE